MMMIKCSAIAATGACVAALALGGCNGPTKAGIEAREEARSRLDVMTTQLSYEQATRAFEVGQFDKALRHIDAAVERHGEAAEYHVLRGRILLETHRLEGAAKAFARAIELDPQLAEAQYLLGVIYQRWSDDQKAYEHYMTAWDRDSTKVQYLLAAAESLVALQAFEEARALVKSKLPYFEHNAALRHLLGSIALLEGDARAAAEMLADARLLSPDDLVLLEEVARAQYRAAMYGRCLESVRELGHRLAEPRTDLRLLEARCLALLGRATEARNLYLDLTRQDPGEPDVWIELGVLSWELGDHRRMAMCGHRATALAPQRYEGYMLQAAVARRRGEVEEAGPLLEQALQRAPDNATARVLLGVLLEQAGQMDAAGDAYASALRLQPDHPKAAALFSRLKDERRVTAVDGDAGTPDLP